MTAPNRIILRGDFTLEEDVASATIKPGMLVETHSSSGKKLRPHGTAKGFAERAFAIEDPLQGVNSTSTQSRGIDDDYAQGERVQYAICKSGALVYAWLEAGADYEVGDKLQSAGDGTLQKNSGSSDLQTIAVVEEALDLSGSGAASARTVVRVL